MSVDAVQRARGRSGDPDSAVSLNLESFSRGTPVRGLRPSLPRETRWPKPRGRAQKLCLRLCAAFPTSVGAFHPVRPAQARTDGIAHPFSELALDLL